MSKLEKFAIAVIAIPISFIIIFSAPISTQILKMDWEGKLSATQLKAKISQAGYKPIYGWYQLREGQPSYISVTSDQNGSKTKIFINAWTGEIYKKEKWKTISSKYNIKRKNTKQPITINKTPDTTPPTIQITYPRNGQTIASNYVVVKAIVKDDRDPNPSIDGTGKVQLQKGSNTIIVTALDKAFNVGSAYLIITRK